MAFWSRKDNKSRDEPTIPVGRMTSVGNSFYSSLSPLRSRNTEILKTLRRIPEENEAIEFLKKVNPDVSMAVWNFVRLANQGHEMHFYAIDGKTRRTDLDDKWRDFAARVNEISNSGLDGLIDQLHYSSYVLGAMGVEAEVTADRKDIYDIYPVKPTTIQWELKEIKGRKMYVPYQEIDFKKVYLNKESANFFWVPADPDIGDPRGSLALTPVLQAVDFQMQILQDVQAVLHHQGYPRNDISMDIEKLMDLCPQNIRQDGKKLNDWLNGQVENMRASLVNMAPDSDYVHTSDTTINQNQGANATRSLDFRALLEGIDPQVLSGLKQMAIFMNRNSGITESWGTVQFRIYCSGIASCQRGSKRIIEEIARLWLRVNGEQATPKFTHNTIDWNSEEQRMTVQLMKQEFFAIAQLMGWISPDEAAQEATGVKEAFDKPSDSIRISFSVGGEKIDNYKHSKEVNNSDIRGTARLL